MTIHGLNAWGVVIGFIVTFVSGGIWFGPKTFYPVWFKEKGLPLPTREEAKSPIYLFGGTIVSVIIEVMTIGIIVTSLQAHQPNIGILDGAGIGFTLGFGIAAINSLPHRLFSHESYKVWIIECSNDVINMTLVGAIIAFKN